MPSSATFTGMTNKPRIYLALYHRARHSFKEENVLRRFHWAILIRPKASKRRNVDCSVFDATTCFHFAPDGKVLNPNQEWWFRVRDHYDPLEDYRFLGAIMIGKLPEGKTIADVDVLLEEIELPQPCFDGTEDYTIWAADAVRALMERKWADKMNVPKLFRECVMLGNGVLGALSRDEPLREGDRWRNFTTRED
ncbi:Hypothetical predicted protein [Lecanosticta acicola]|uniref:Uncharacterized protein n=1 Tax=Lecanosticta acicola TaxID=111012 RepID=A0AAI8Z5X9_9PEZI|nr:Hypothetical predicted protein [Lecanosticta acicola]